jgi:serine phosphatase RsbU (regulator of sigma subunit)
MEDLAPFLQQVSIFKDLSLADLRLFVQQTRLLQVPANSVLFLEGECGDAFYIVYRGELEIIKALGSTEESRIGLLAPGMLVGEMSLINPDGRRSATVRTVTPSEVIEITREQFNDQIRRNPTLAYSLLEIMSARVSVTTNRTIEFLQEKNQQLQEAFDQLKAAQQQLIEKERLEKELQVAREIQLSILPAALPDVTGYTFGALMQAARAVGGDFYDLFRLGDDCLGVLIGDVSDKGVPAAIFMAQTNALLRAAAHVDHSPVETLATANRLLVDFNASGQFVTVLYGKIHLATGEFIYARAGHELPIIISTGGEADFAPFSKGIALGVMSEMSVEEARLQLSPGEMLVLYTDGVTDGLVIGKGGYGDEELLALVTQAPGSHAQVFCDYILDEIQTRQGDRSQFDDITLLVLQRLE